PPFRRNIHSGPSEGTAAGDAHGAGFQPELLRDPRGRCTHWTVLGGLALGGGLTSGAVRAATSYARSRLGGGRSPATLSRSVCSPCSSASGQGGQPGTYTSTGSSWSTPLVTEYESQYGPPQLAQAPNEMTYVGPGSSS